MPTDNRIRSDGVQPAPLQPAPAQFAPKPFVPPPASAPGLTVVEAIASAISVVWLVGVGAFFLVMPAGEDGGSLDSLRFVMTLMAIFLPVAMIWVAAAAARSNRIMREESRRLQIAIDAMRQSYVADRQGRTSNGGGYGPSVEQKLNEIAKATRQTESVVVATFASTRDANRRAVPVAKPSETDAEDQPTLALGTNVEDVLPPLARADLIRALNFPDTDQDEAGFAALRRALKDRQARKLVQAAQDILTLLSQDGIYMDDMRPDRARPEIWRRFAGGERGRAIAALGGVRDRTSLALTSGRMREDPVFRDAAHHFLRLFDRTLVTFEPEATDEDIVALAETRSARAFMVLGRVTGAFS